MTFEQHPREGQYPGGGTPQYGQPGYGYGQPGYGYPVPDAQPGNGLAIAGMVCGIVGLLFLWIILSPLAIIFGGVGWSRANAGARYKGMAIAGVVLGIVGIVGYILLFATVLNDARYF